VRSQVADIYIYIILEQQQKYFFLKLFSAINSGSNYGKKSASNFPQEKTGTQKKQFCTNFASTKNDVLLHLPRRFGRLRRCSNGAASMRPHLLYPPLHRTVVQPLRHSGSPRPSDMSAMPSPTSPRRSSGDSECGVDAHVDGIARLPFRIRVTPAQRSQKSEKSKNTSLSKSHTKCDALAGGAAP
jgi:hypothetical protein